MSFNPAKDIPNLSGKVFFITGGTTGLGKQTILDISKHSPSHIFFTGRNATAAEALIESLSTSSPSTKLTFIKCDQQSLQSVAKATQTFLSHSSRLDILICNAGVMATAPFLTEDGYENQFGVNHVSHALFVKLLLPIIQSTAAQPSSDARILFLTSLGFHMAFTNGGILFDSLKTTQDFPGERVNWSRYGQSKLANVLYASEIAKRHPEILTVSVHPGSILTGLITTLDEGDRKFVEEATKDLGPILNVDVGAYNICWCATSKREGVLNGSLYLPVGQVGEHSAFSNNEKLSRELWAWTEKELENF